MSREPPRGTCSPRRPRRVARQDRDERRPHRTRLRDLRSAVLRHSPEDVGRPAPGCRRPRRAARRSTRSSTRPSPRGYGGRRSPSDDGYVDGRSFHDLDGHAWEVMWMALRTPRGYPVFSPGNITAARPERRRGTVAGPTVRPGRRPPCCSALAPPCPTVPGRWRPSPGTAASRASTSSACRSSRGSRRVTDELVLRAPDGVGPRRRRRADRGRRRHRR